MPTVEPLFFARSARSVCSGVRSASMRNITPTIARRRSITSSDSALTRRCAGVTTSGHRTPRMASMTLLVAIPYLVVLTLLVALAAHRGHLVWLLLKHKAASPPTPPPAPAADGESPIVTVQLPLYNEPEVVERLIDSVAALDWPRDRLE